MRRCLRSAVLAALCHVGFSATAASAQDGRFDPIFPLNPTFKLPLPLDIVLFDPSYANFTVTDDGTAKQLEDQNIKLEAQIATKSGKDKSALQSLVIRNYVVLAQQRALALDAKGPDAVRADAKLRNFREKVVDLSRSYTGTSAATSEAQSVLYNGYLAKFLMQEPTWDNMATLRTWVKKLEPNLAKRALLLIAFNDFIYGNATEKRAAHAAAARLVDSLPAPAAASGQLLLARSLANIDINGVATKAADPSYRAAVKKAALLGQKLPAPLKGNVFQASLFIWKTAEDRKINWQSPPFDINPYGEMPEIRAILERQALTKVDTRNYTPAIKLYESFVKALGPTPIAGRLDERIIVLQSLAYARSSNAKVFEGALTDKINKYKTPSVLGKDGEAFVKTFHASLLKLYKDLALSEAKKGLVRNAPRPSRQEAIRILGAYANLETDANERESALAVIGTLHALNNDHVKAAAQFLELASIPKQSPEKKRFYLKQALASQHILAKWPEKNPFDLLTSKKKYDSGDLQKLLVIYESYAKALANPSDWAVVAQIGVLQIKLGQEKKAYDLWQSTIKKDKNPNEALKATGYLLTVYADKSNWDELETLAKFARLEGIRPEWQNKFVDPKEMLGLALFNGGKQDLLTKKYPNAIRRLDDYVRTFATRREHDEAIVLLALAQRGAGQHMRALKTYLSLNQIHPSSPFVKKMLLEGGDYATSIAQEKWTLVFYEQYLKKFPDEADTAKVQLELAKLYLSQNNAAGASELFKTLLTTAKNLPKATLRDIADRYVDVEAERGGNKAALIAAGTAMKVMPDVPELKARFLLLQARLFTEELNFGKVVEIERDMAALGVGSEALVEALGEVRFMVAENQAGSMMIKMQSLNMTDPAKTLAQMYELFKAVDQSYEKVCSAGKTSFCAPAYFRLSTFASQFSTSYRKARLPDSMSSEAAKDFKEKRRKVLVAVRKSYKDALAKAASALSKGQSSPTWVRRIWAQKPGDRLRDLAIYSEPKVFVQIDKSAARPKRPKRPSKRVASTDVPVKQGEP